MLKSIFLNFHKSIFSKYYPCYRPEIDIKPWVPLLEDLKKGNKVKKWVKREPYAYWKGNEWVAPTRQDLFKCKRSDKHDWNARLYGQVSTFLIILDLMAILTVLFIYLLLKVKRKDMFQTSCFSKFSLFILLGSV